MLLRSTSSPILKAWSPADHAAAAGDFLSQISIPKTRSIAQISPSISFSSSNSSTSPLSRARSESNLHGLGSIPLEEDVGFAPKASSSNSPSLERLLSSSGLDGMWGDGINRYSVTDDDFGGGCDGGGGGRRRSSGGGEDGDGINRYSVTDDDFGGGCDGGGGGRRRSSGGGEDGDGSWDDKFGFKDPKRSNEGTDDYYLKMIEANPGNSLVLVNFAKFLNEVRGDLVKAKEYCERAIVASPGDAEALALYADLIWRSNKDAERAEGYFDRAVQADPQDCYVMASYAHFLWDAEEEEEEEEKTYSNTIDSEISRSIVSAS